MQGSIRALAALLALIVAASCWAVPYWQEKGKSNADQQKQSDKNKGKESDKDKDKNKKKEDESPFGSGKINLLHSSQKSDAASAGFNGVGPTGEVDKKRLEQAATADDYNKAQQVSFIGVKASALKKFIQEGKLNTASPKSDTKTDTASPKKS